MKRCLLIMMVLLSLSSLAADPINVFRFGFLAPKDVYTGTIAGYCYGSTFDNTVTLFTSGDLFYRNYTKQKKIGYYEIANSGTHVATYLKTADISTYYIPLFLNGQVNIPMQDKFRIYCGGGFGFGLLWEDVFVAADPEHMAVDETKFFSGFNWNLRSGVRYPLSRHTALIGELFYNSGRMRRDILETPVGITWHEINMDGIGLRVGLEVPAF